MAEFCLDCWNELIGSEYSPQCFLFSREPDLCEMCGAWKPVIVRFQRRYLVLEWFDKIYRSSPGKQP